MLTSAPALHVLSSAGSQRSLPEEFASLDLVGESTATKKLRLQIERIGPHFRTLLLQGEIGSGKELVARALHARSRGGSFSVCHGATLTTACETGVGSVWEVILQGGRGTIFIDGVEELRAPAQARVLELVRRIRSGTTQQRVIAASGQNLRQLLDTGWLRPELYYQLAMIEITIMPLRERPEDIPTLADHFLQHFGALYGKEAEGISEAAMRYLCRHRWLGNVRELENVLRNAVLLCEGPTLELEHIGQLLGMEGNGLEAPYHGENLTRVENLQEVIDRHVLGVLRMCEGNKVRAAEILGISRSTLYRMLDGLAATNGTLAWRRRR